MRAKKEAYIIGYICTYIYIYVVYLRKFLLIHICVKEAYIIGYICKYIYIYIVCFVCKKHLTHTHMRKRTLHYTLHYRLFFYTEPYTIGYFC